jgi:hypothetical protein
MVQYCPNCRSPNTGPSCTCGVAYISAGEVAERRLRADPTHADRKIAEEEGLTHPTVASKRAELESTGKILPVDKVIGLDGKWRSYKRGKQRRSRTVRDTPDKRGRTVQANFGKVNKEEFEAFIAEQSDGRGSNAILVPHAQAAAAQRHAGKKRMCEFCHSHPGLITRKNSPGGSLRN